MGLACWPSSLSQRPGAQHRWWLEKGLWHDDAVMEVTPEKVAEVEQQLDELTKKAEETDQRIAALKQDVAQVKDRAEKIRRRLKGA